VTTVPKLRALDCPQCGGPITPRTFGHALNVVCPSCGSVLDATDPRLQVLQAHATKAQKLVPLIPLGTRGTWRGQPYEAVGFQQRTITVEGVRYSWREYLLFNPYRGFRYLTEYDGHWNDVVPLRGVPAREGRSPAVDGQTFRQFQTARATTTFVLGEFPWQVRTGDEVQATDYVAPPRILSSEIAGDEETWSVGDYVDGRDVWKAFKLTGRPPGAKGVYANQPSRWGARVGPMWATFALLSLLVLGECAVRQALARRETAFQGQYTFRARPGDDSAFVTDVFELRGRPSSVQVTTESDRISNDWLYLDYALIDEASGRAWEFGREVSYYSGRDEDGAWTEGKRRDQVSVPAVPSGRYYLRVKPEGEANRPPVSYDIRVRRDVPSLLLPALALLALAIPPVLVTVLHLSFEQKRWMESDNPPITVAIAGALTEDD